MLVGRPHVDRSCTALALLCAGAFSCLVACSSSPPIDDAGALLDAPSVDAHAVDGGSDAGAPFPLSGFSLSAWEVCPGAPATAISRCAVLTTPLDWSRPDGRKIRRPVRRYPATGDRRGLLFWNPGGPGAATFPARPLGDAPEIVAAYDVISLDWRGVGASDITLSCPRPDSVEIYRYQTTTGALADSIDRAVELSRAISRDCLAAIDPELVEHVGSDDMARDLEAMRILLGEERISYLGYSYGTVLGAAYARAYPDRVDAFVLDSPVHPHLDWLADETAQIASQEAAFERFFDWCARRDCAFAQGRDAETLGDVFDALVDELLERPRFAVGPTGAENVVGASMFLGWVVGELRNPGFWPGLGEGLRGMEAGDFTPLTSEFSEPSETTSLGLVVIAHLDRPLLEPWEPADVAEHFLSEILPSAPHSGYSFPGRFGDALAMREARGRQARPLDFSAPDAPPVLVIGGRHDTQTPYEGAVAMRDAVGRGSYLLRYEGDGHAIGDRVPCTRREVIRFLLDPSLPPAVESCPAIEVMP